MVDDALEVITNTMGSDVKDVCVREELIGIGIKDFTCALIYRQWNQNIINDMKNLVRKFSLTYLP